MAKKLIIVWLSITIVTFSSISIYAMQQATEDFLIPKTSFEEIDQILSKTNDVFAANAIWEKDSRTIAVTKTAKQNDDIAQKKEKEEQNNKYLKGLAAYIHKINRNVNLDKAFDMATYFVKYAKKYDVDVNSIMAIAQNESCYYNDVVSSCGHKGLMQAGDGIARNAGYSPDDLFNPEISIKVGARYFSIKMDEFNDTTLALTAYNQGSGSVNSGNYSTGYAELALARADDISEYLKSNGYVE